MIEKLEMVTCPRCGKLFPKKRKDLGYGYCCDCSTEKSKTCRIEDQGEGEDTFTTLTILTQEEALAISQAEKKAQVDQIPDQDSAPDYSTFEEQDENLSAEQQTGDVFRDELKLTELEKEFAGMSERTLEEMEQLIPLIDDEEPEGDLLDDD